MTMKPSRRLALTAAVSTVLFAAPTTLLAAGFYIQEQGASGLGRAYAGEAAIASDASTIYFNPAGMTRLESDEVQVGGASADPEYRGQEPRDDHQRHAV